MSEPLPIAVAAYPLVATSKSDSPAELSITLWPITPRRRLCDHGSDEPSSAYVTMSRYWFSFTPAPNRDGTSA